MIKKILQLIFITGILLVIGFYFWQHHASISQPVSHTVTIAGTMVAVQVSDTDALRMHGLSDSDPLLPDTGMFFIFPEPGVYPFWMKDMRYSIDMIWFDSQYNVAYIKSDATPESYPETFGPTSETQYVLEVPDGFAKLHHVSIGDHVVFK